jgi:hypothetical protein
MKTKLTDNVIRERARAYASQWRICKDYPEDHYKWLIDYAEKQADGSIKTIEYLDGKADAMLRQIGILVTLLGLILGYAASREAPQGYVLYFLPVLFALLFSVISAIQCSRPQLQPRRPLIKQAFTYTSSAVGTRLYFMRAWIYLEYDLWLMGQKKAAWIRSSHYGLVIAIVWLILGVTVIVSMSMIDRILVASRLADSPYIRKELTVVLAGLLSVVVLAWVRYRNFSNITQHFWETEFPDTTETVES